MALTETDILAIQATPQSHYDIIVEGPVSTVERAWISMKDGQPQWIVVKSATVVRKFSRAPHDIVKELRILTSLSNQNIISVLGSFEDEDEEVLKLYMPYIPISLADLLSSPFFSPHPFPPTATPDAAASRQQERQFTTIARSIIFQVLSAVAYLHDDSRQIAHRDIKPENILLTRDGCVKLIDFGVCWQANEPGLEKEDDIWPEYAGKLYFEVCTGAYRAPELLFGTRSYDALAVDRWGLGATFAQFFTPLRLSSDDTDDDDEHDCGDDDAEAEEGHPTATQPFIVPKYLRIGYPGSQWSRDTLFNGDRGEIGLAWSIFKIYGTPTPDNWPEFDDLPGSKSVVFNVVPAVAVEPLLPNLPPSSRTTPLPTSSTTPRSSSASRFPSSSSTSTSLNGYGTGANGTRSSPPAPPQPPPQPEHLPLKPVPTPFDLLSRFLVYPTASRQKASTALLHPWITADNLLLLPPNYYTADPLPASSTMIPQSLRKISKYEWQGKSLGEWVHSVLLSIPGGSGGGRSS